MNLGREGERKGVSGEGRRKSGKAGERKWEKEEREGY